jgi:hypothetical protein
MQRSGTPRWLNDFRLTAALGGGGTFRWSDPAEIAGRRAGLARLLDRQAVADLAKIASSLLRGESAWA